MVVEQSIFKATKVMLDVAPSDDSFDAQILTFINSALSDLNDLGLGPEFGLNVTGDTEVWDDLEESPVDTDRIKNFLYLKVRILWDPPQTGFLVDLLNNQINESAWRLVNKRDHERYLTTHPESATGDDTLVLDGGVG